MGFPVNISSDTKDYMLIHDLKNVLYAKNVDVQQKYLHLCKHEDDSIDTNAYRYYGVDVYVMRLGQDNLLAKARYLYYSVSFNDNEYSVKYNDELYCEIPYNTSVLNKFNNHKLIRATQSALRYSISPTEQSWEIYDLLNILQAEHVTETQWSIKIIHALLDKRTNIFNDVDTAHVAIKLQHVNVSDIYHYINHTYVNIVYDCKTACSQAVISDDYDFASAQRAEQYIMSCSHKLLSYTLHETTTTQQYTKHSAQRSKEICEECNIYISALPLTFSAIVAIGSMIAVAIKISDSKCAQYMRTHLAECMSTLSSYFMSARRIAKFTRCAAQTSHDIRAEELIVDEI